MQQKPLIDRWLEDEHGCTVIKPAPTLKKKPPQKKIKTKKCVKSK